MIHGVDVSAYQPNFDFSAARREGFDFAFIKATEGTGWRSPNYRDQVRRAREAGMIVAAYHYVRGTDALGQLANIRAMVDGGTPVILDVETGAGDPASVKRLLDYVRQHYPSNLIYVPNWYWTSHWGRPDLRSWGLAGNWHSEYPDRVVRRLDGFRDWIATRFDRTVGGLPTVVMQFAESLAVANYPNGRIDGNAFKGSRDDLRALLEGDDMPSAEEYAKAVVDEFERRRYETTENDGTAVKPGKDSGGRSFVNMLQHVEQLAVWQNQRGPRTENRLSDVAIQVTNLDGALAKRDAELLTALRSGSGLSPQEQAELLVERLDDAVVRAVFTVAQKALAAKPVTGAQ